MNKIISILGILAFIFGLLLASSPVYASVSSTMYSGNVTVNPVNYYPSVPSSYYYNSNSYASNYPVVIPGCEGRATGFSTVNGQPCTGNYVGNTTTNNYTNTSNNNQTTNTTSNTSKTTTTSTKTTTASTANKSNNKVALAGSTTCTTAGTASDVNQNYGNLTANALEGSNSFLPTGLLQWIILAIIITAIVFLWRYVHAEEKYLSEPLKHA